MRVYPNASRAVVSAAGLSVALIQRIVTDALSPGPVSMLRRKWIIILVLLVVAATAFVAMRRSSGSATTVTSDTVRRRPLFRSTVTASGQIVATRYADIGSSVMGRIVALNVKEGDRVKAGQVLARIDPVQARADLAAADALTDVQRAELAAADEQIRSAEADAAFATARLRQTQLELERTRELSAQQLAPRADLDARQAEFDSAQAQLRATQAAIERTRNARKAASQRIAQAQAQAARARDIVSKTEIAAPIDGIVSRLQVREGEMVVIGIQNQPGTVLMTVSDLSAIDAEVKVAEADVLRLALDQPASVVLEALPGKQFSGKVVEIGASALPVVGTTAAAREFRVVIRLDQADAALRPGLTCDAEILSEERANVLTVPLQSVVLRPAAAGPDGRPRDQSGVFAIEGDRAKFVPVTTGIIGGLDIEVTGPTEGTPIVIGPYQALRQLTDGARIREQKSPAR